VGADDRSGGPEVNRWLRTGRSVALLGLCDAAELERRTLAYYSQRTPFDQTE
jgi:hypothetical protein